MSIFDAPPAPASWADSSIETYVGEKFDVFSPRPGLIYLDDVMHALALKCRYTGHCARHYSVAEHCILMSAFVAEEGGSIALQKWALLHDAAEAYLPDVAGPVKPCIVGFRDLEEVVLNVVAARFELATPRPDAALRFLDILFYLLERETIMKPAAWLPPFGAYFPKRTETAARAFERLRSSTAVACWSPGRAEQEYYDAFRELFGDTSRWRYDGK